MVLIPVRCLHCHSDQVIKGGKTKAGQQRYKCQNTACPHYSFQRDLLYKGRAPAIKEQIVDMSLNGQTPPRHPCHQWELKLTGSSREKSPLGSARFSF